MFSLSISRVIKLQYYGIPPRLALSKVYYAEVASGSLWC